MQNIKPPQLSPVHVPSPSEVLQRVLAVAVPPLAPGENEAQYASLAAHIVAAARPQDTIEELLTREVVDRTWEIHRLQRIKSGILRASMNEGVETVMHRFGYRGSPGPFQLGQKWAAGEKGAKDQVARALSAAGLSIDEVTATTFERKIDTFSQIERILASVEARRNDAFREIDRHRSACAAAVRQTLKEVEDVEFRDVESGKVTGATQS